MKNLLILLSILTPLLQNQALSKVDPPNYNFSLDALSVFLPGSSFDAMKSKHGGPEMIKEVDDAKIYRFSVAQIRYKFPVYVSIINNKSVDFHARLPTYFSHDLFHQALINRYKKQDQYLKKENSALYIWNNSSNVKHTYSATCTITCFPIFYSASQVPLPKGHVPVTNSLIIKEN